MISGIGISEYGVKGWISAFRLSDGEPALEGTGFELPIPECDESGFAIAVAAREELKVCRLPAGGEWIRTSGPSACWPAGVRAVRRRGISRPLPAREAPGRYSQQLTTTAGARGHSIPRARDADFPPPRSPAAANLFLLVPHQRCRPAGYETIDPAKAVIAS